MKAWPSPSYSCWAFSIIPFIAPSLVGNVGYSEDKIFLIYLVGGILTIFTAPQVGKIADRRGKYPVLYFLPCFPSYPSGWSQFMAHAHVGSIGHCRFVFITVNGRMIPMQAIVSSVTMPNKRGGFMSINSSVQQLASGIAATIGGAIVAEGPGGRIEHYSWVGYFP